MTASAKRCATILPDSNSSSAWPRPDRRDRRGWGAAISHISGRTTFQGGRPRAPVVILSLPSPEALATVVDGTTGLLQSKSSNLIVIEISTLPIDAKQRALDLLSPRGVHLLDCPLSGTGAQARNKDLVVFASGDETAFRSCNLIFDAMSRRQVYLGAFGNGTIMKLLANHLVTIHNVAAG